MTVKSSVAMDNFVLVCFTKELNEKLCLIDVKR
ncbi:unnamed protein product [Schistosoma mattheei]|uniref:Uncharacterized protein n=1 Tax=Schistosoma mattheei TaxID=31246 RepID=A0A183NRX9_9TREM|nr:unnamed protein product [Schistosoma mattheei]